MFASMRRIYHGDWACRRALPAHTGIDSVGVMSANDPLREQAINRLKAKRQFWGLVVIWIGVSAFCVLIWAISGVGYFWPMWPMIGIGIGVVAAGWRAFSPNAGGISESRIQAEMDKLR